MADTHATSSDAGQAESMPSPKPSDAVNAAYNSGDRATSTEPAVDTISGATKELLEARSPSTPEAAKNETLIGAVAIGICLVLLSIFAFFA